MRSEAREGMGAGSIYEHRTSVTAERPDTSLNGKASDLIAPEEELQKPPGNIFGPRFDAGERVNPALIVHRQTVATAVYVAELNTYVPREDLPE